MHLTTSPVSQFNFNARTFFVKRDDLLKQQFNGNKARKLAYYLELPSNSVDTIISYGGNQSNMMYALACLAKLKNWQFIYYTGHLSKQAVSSNNSNLGLSLAKGMKLIPTSGLAEAVENIKPGARELLIRQGGLQVQSEYGIKMLADEIRHWAVSNHLPQINIFVASGTGTTAFFLQKHLPDYQVITTNCVGNRAYLLKQMEELRQKSITSKLPMILENTQYRFAKPDKDLLATITAINQASRIEFDLVYDPVGFKILLDNLHLVSADPLLYIHCGGLTGNPSMRRRYQSINSSN